MTILMTAGLALAALAGGTSATALDHVVTLDHGGGPVEARYRGEVRVAHRQLGAVSPAGRPSTLRCRWTAGLAIDRNARTAGGTLARRIVANRAIDGSRPGWCSANRTAIARDVAARMDAVHARFRALAQQDHETLRAELGRLHGPVRAG